MVSMKKLVLGAAVAIGGLVAGAAPANAAVRVFVGAPAAYVPPCPGAGYVWVAPYQIGGVWYPGRWNFVGVGVRDRYFHERAYFPRFDEHRFYGDRFDGRRFDRDHDRFRR